METMGEIFYVKGHKNDWRGSRTDLFPGMVNMVNDCVLYPGKSHSDRKYICPFTTESK